MKIFDPAVYIEEYDGMKIMKNIEKAARTCYKSEANISEDSYKRIIINCIKSGHESVIEHEKISVKVFGDLSLMQDIPGHRLASFSNESTRYCNYGKNKYENQLRIIKQPHFEKGTKLYEEWEKSMKIIEESYVKMSNMGGKPDQLRMLLSLSTIGEMNMTCNIREWRYILRRHCSASYGHPPARQIFIPLLLKFKEDMPELFSDIEYDEEFPKEKYAKILPLDKYQ